MTLQEFFDVKESYRLPDKIMEMLLSPDAEKTITQIKEQISCDIRPVWERSRFLRSGLRRCPRPASGRPVVRLTCFSYSGRIKLLRKIWTAELFALPPFFPLPTVIRRLARAGCAPVERTDE